MESKEQPVHSMTAIPEIRKPEDMMRISGQGHTPFLMKQRTFMIPGMDHARGVP
jgi:hypothetical protein